MDRERHQRLSVLFRVACDLGTEQRRRFLDRECAGDERLRAEVEELLAQDRQASELDATQRLAAPVAGHEDETLELDTEGRAAHRSLTGVRGYRFVRELGSGGAGTVYEAIQEGIERRVAVKVMAERLALSAHAGKRFEREAWINGRLTHPNIVRVYEQGLDGDVPYFSMEFVEGGSLHDVLVRLRDHGEDTRLGLRFGSRDYVHWVLDVFQQAARALQYTHDRGIVHRDIKPMNLLLDVETSTLKLADFGIAVEDSASRLTGEGQILGTLRYMPPEQLRGDLEAIGPRSDVYSLGISLYEMTTLRSPYPDESREGFLEAVLSGTPRKTELPKDVLHRDLAVVIGKAIEHLPENRYASPGELADDLQRIAEGRPILARPPSLAGRLQRWARRKPAHAALALTLLVAVPTTGWIVYRNWQQTRRLDAIRVDRLHRELRRIREDPVALRDKAREILAVDGSDSRGLRAVAVSFFNESLRHDASAPKAAEECKRASEEWISRVPESGEPLRTYAYFLSSWGEEDAAAELRARAEKYPRTYLDDYNDVRLELDRGVDDPETLRAALGVLNDVLDHEEGMMALEDRQYVNSRLGNLDAALVDLRVLRGMDPSDPWPERKIGKLLTRKGDYAEARAHFQRAEELGDTSPDLPLELSDLLHKWGVSLASQDEKAAVSRFSEGAAVARAGLARDPENAALWLNLGTHLVEIQRLSEAPDPGPLVEAGEAFAESQRLAQEQDREDIEALAAIAQCDALVLARHPDTALPVCERSVALNPTSDTAQYNLAEAYALAGETEAALDALAQDHALGDDDYAYLEADPLFEDLRGEPRYAAIVESMKRADGP